MFQLRRHQRAGARLLFEHSDYALRLFMRRHAPFKEDGAVRLSLLELCDRIVRDEEAC